MKTGILLTLVCWAALGGLFTAGILFKVIDAKNAEIAYYELAMSEISHDMTINYRLHKNAIGALKNIRSIPCKRSHK